MDTETLGNWVQQSEIDPGHRPGATSDEAQRIAELKRKSRELRRANKILRTASLDSTSQGNRAASRLGPVS